MRLPRVRLTVRTLMALVLVFGGGFGWVVHRAHVQRDAIAVIRRDGGRIAYSWQWSKGLPVSRPPKTPWADWVRRRLGPDFIDTVSYVALTGGRCDDESLRAACRLPWLEELTVVNTSVTDVGAEDLRQLKKLRSLDLRLNRITSRPLRHIGEMSELRELKLAMRLSPVPLRDEDMAFLRRLTKLERLMLPSRDLTGAWLVYLEGLTRLRLLEVYDMAITPEGLDHLKGLSNLQAVLTLQGTQIPLRRPGVAAPGLDEAKTHPLIRLSRRK
jgi:hypothetical protein